MYVCVFISNCIEFIFFSINGLTYICYFAKKILAYIYCFFIVNKI